MANEETPTTPDTLPAGSAGDPTPPKLGTGKRDWVGEAKAKLAEKEAAAAPGTPPAAEPPAPAQEPAAEPAAPTATQSLADRLAAGESAPEPAAEPTKEPALDGDDPNVNASLLKIMEMERTLREEREALKADRERMGVLVKAQELIDQGVPKLEVLAALGEGFTYEDLTKEVIGGDASAGATAKEIEELRAELARVKEDLPKEWEEKLKASETARAEAEQTALKQQATSKLHADRDRWGLITDPSVMHGRDAADMVLELMQESWVERGQKPGDYLSFDEAADMLEASFEKRVREQAAQGPSKLARILGLTTAPTAHPETAAPTHAGSSPDAPVSKTLTPDLATRTPAAAGDKRPMKSSDYVRRAKERLEEIR